MNTFPKAQVRYLSLKRFNYRDGAVKRTQGLLSIGCLALTGYFAEANLERTVRVSTDPYGVSCHGSKKQKGDQSEVDRFVELHPQSGDGFRGLIELVAVSEMFQLQ